MAVLTLRPNAPGDTTQTFIGGTSPAATHWESVCEVIPDEEVTYIYITIGFYYAEFNLPNHTTEIDTIVSVKVVIRCRYEEEGKSGSAGCRIKTGGVGYNKSPNGGLSANYVNYSYEWTTNPRTGLPWTWDDIDALQAGVYLSATTPVNWPRCTQLYVEVEYGAPTVSTQATTDIAETTATGNGTIVRVGLADVTQHGHCWSTSANPTIVDSKTENGADGVGAFTSAITELTPSTLYHVRAYATNSIGTAYSDDETFTTRAWAHLSLDIKNISLPYEDLDKTKELHIVLKNLSPTSKEAGADGEVVIDVKYEPAA